MLSSAYLPTAGLPGRLRTVSEWNPISAVATPVRELCGNAGGSPAQGSAWPAAHPVAGAVLWSLLLLALCVPAATRRFARDPPEPRTRAPPEGVTDRGRPG